MDINNSETLSVLLRQCINFLFRKRQKIAKNVGGIPESQSRILRELLQSDGMSQKELLQKLQIRQPSLVEFLVKLEHSGYIERRKNQDDKRITNVFLTDKVNESRKQVGVEREKMSRDLFCALTDEEQTALIVLLKKLVAAWTDEDV